MTNQYSDKDYFTIQAALNQAAATQQQAAKDVIASTNATVGGNVDYFKQLADISAKLLAPYTALAQQSTPMLYDVLGLNGKAAQQNATAQASNIFQQQGIYAAPLVSSIPGWSFNTAANQASSFINGMFGYGTNQPTAQASATVQMPGLYRAPQKGTYTTQVQAQNPWNAPAPYQAYTKPATPFDSSSYDKQIADINAAKAAEQAKIDRFNQLQSAARSANDNYLQALRGAQQAQTGGPVTADSQYNILSNKANELNAVHQTAATQLNDYIKANNLQLSQANGANPYTQQAALTGNYDKQIADVQAAMKAAQNPQQPAQQQPLVNRQMQQQMAAQATQVPVLNQPALQSQANPEMIGLLNQFKAAQQDVNNVAGNTSGALAGILQQASNFGRTANPEQMGYANQFVQRALADSSGNEANNPALAAATNAAKAWIDSDLVKQVMGATVGAGTNAVQNAAAARGMLDSGQTLAELQKVGTNAAGQYIVPFASQLANNRMTNYYNMLGKGMDFANQAYNQQNQNMLSALGTGANIYGQNLQARTGMATSGLNFANNLAQMQAGMSQNLANQYAGIGNQFANTLQNNANSTANQQNALQQGGLANLLSGGQQASTNTANIYSGLGGNVSGQTMYGNDIYGNATMYGANVEANRLNQAAQLQVLMDQYDRAKKAQSMGMGMNAGGLALSLGAMALGGGL